MFELWKAAVEAGGPDNITIALARAGAWTSAVLAAAKRLATPSQHAGPPGTTGNNLRADIAAADASEDPWCRALRTEKGRCALGGAS